MDVDVPVAPACPAAQKSSQRPSMPKVARKRDWLAGRRFHNASEQIKSAIAIQGRELYTREDFIITDRCAR